VVIPIGVTDLYTFISNTSFRALRGKATQIIIIWRFNGLDYKQLSLKYQALKEEKKRIEKVR
jgi:hypothetical protein